MNMNGKAVSNLLMLQQQWGQSDQNYSMGMGEAFERQDGSKRSLQFSKTQMCKFNLMGACNRGAACRWAHSNVDLKSRPDLSRTRMCRIFLDTGRCNNEDCMFAHSREELRATDSFHKTKMCRFWQVGHCTLGDNCRFAHSLDELREEEVSAAMAQLAQQQDQQYNTDLATNAAVLTQIRLLLQQQKQLLQLQQQMQSMQCRQQQEQRMQHDRNQKKSHQENYSARVTPNNTDSRTPPIQTPCAVPPKQLIVNGQLVSFPANAYPLMQEPSCPPCQGSACTARPKKNKCITSFSEVDRASNSTGDSSVSSQPSSGVSGPGSFLSHSNSSVLSPPLPQNSWSSDSEIDLVETTSWEPSHNGSSAPDFPEEFEQETVTVVPSGPRDRYCNAPWKQKKSGTDLQISQAPLDALTESEPTPGDDQFLGFREMAFLDQQDYDYDEDGNATADWYEQTFGEDDQAAFLSQAPSQATEPTDQNPDEAVSFEIKNTFVAIKQTEPTCYPLRHVRSAEGSLSELKKS